MPLLNVRLAPEDARRAKALRAKGVAISTLVRAAIRAEYDRRVVGGRRRSRPSRILAEILADLPDPPDLPPTEIDRTDRRAVRRHIAARLGRERS
jgi:hypothetical protein